MRIGKTGQYWLVNGPKEFATYGVVRDLCNLIFVPWLGRCSNIRSPIAERPCAGCEAGLAAGAGIGGPGHCGGSLPDARLCRWV
ncbi:MAG: hypothetical protein EBU21_14940 [Proteobacteria bacterium]|nr:hypothetical protein [Pseudomonadota bacterium]